MYSICQAFGLNQKIPIVGDLMAKYSLARSKGFGVSSLIRFAHKWLLPGLGAQTNGAPPSFKLLRCRNRQIKIPSIKLGIFIRCATL
jgi:hypothetical protein